MNWWFLLFQASCCHWLNYLKRIVRLNTHVFSLNHTHYMHTSKSDFLFCIPLIIWGYWLRSWTYDARLSSSLQRSPVKEWIISPVSQSHTKTDLWRTLQGFNLKPTGRWTHAPEYTALWQKENHRGRMLMVHKPLIRSTLLLIWATVICPPCRIVWNLVSPLTVWSAMRTHNIHYVL